MAIDGINNVNLNVKTETVNSVKSNDNEIALFQNPKIKPGDTKLPLGLRDKTALKNCIEKKYPQYEVVSIDYDKATMENIIKIKLKENTYPVEIKPDFWGRLSGKKAETVQKRHTLGSIRENFGLDKNVLKTENKNNHVYPYGNQELFDARRNSDENDYDSHFDDKKNYIWDKLLFEGGDVINIPFSEVDIMKLV